MSPACRIKSEEGEEVLADGKTSSLHGSVGVKREVVAVARARGPVDIMFPKFGPNKLKPLMLTSSPFILVKSAVKPAWQPQTRKRKRTQKMGGGVGKASSPSPATAVRPPLPSPACRDKDTDEIMGVSYLCTTVPSDHRPHVCETCGKCFRRELHLRTHRSTHRDERPFSCETCGKTFKLKAILNTHMVVHSPNPPQFACEHCDKCFPTRARLNYHQVTHSSEKKFECGVCRKRYKRKPHLAVHLRSHLSNDDAAALACGS
ncbi:fez family zinc finger protein erm-like [Hetaerina americana]|uniref:fez family zinc finger protein erm-like n=1 Tax=Hetaerina americana TaxID=62018 RepID=UPI003A7F5438